MPTKANKCQHCGGFYDPEDGHYCDKSRIRELENLLCESNATLNIKEEQVAYLKQLVSCLEQQCAAMRAALVRSRVYVSGYRAGSERNLTWLDATLSTDCGKGWVSPEEWANLERKNQLLIQTIEAIGPQLDRARMQCAEMRRALEETSDSPGRRCWCYGRHSESPEPHLDFCMQAQHALSADCGKGWVSPEETENRRRIHEGELRVEREIGREYKKQLEQALAERDQARKDSYDMQELMKDCDPVRVLDLEAQLTAALNERDQYQAEAAAAVDWAGKARHLPHCRINPSGPIMEALGDSEKRPCSCGRQEALNGTAAKELLNELEKLREHCKELESVDTEGAEMMDDVMKSYREEIGVLEMEKKELQAKNEKLQIVQDAAGMALMFVEDLQSLPTTMRMDELVIVRDKLRAALDACKEENGGELRRRINDRRKKTH